MIYFEYIDLIVGDEILARPRVIELNNGEISLSGYSKEEADELSEYIKGFKASNQTTSGGSIIIPSSSLPSEYSALSVVDEQVSNNHHLVLVRFNLTDPNVEILKTALRHGDIVNQFKVKASELNFV